MRVLIIGAGQVGLTVMNELRGNHSISLINKNPDVLDSISYDIDVYAGDGLNKSTLEEAGVSNAELVLATTSEDQTNLLICNMVKVLSDAFTVARVSDPTFVKTWDQSQGAFGVDELIGRANLSAREISKIIGLQSSDVSALDETSFCQENVKMAEYRLTKASPALGKTVNKLDDKLHVTIGALIRQGELIFPSGDTRLKLRDKIAVFGNSNDIDQFAENYVNPGKAKLHQSVDILGGGDVGFQTATLLEDTNLSVRVFEAEQKRAEFLSKNLKETMVLKGDVTELSVWEEENITETELIVHSTGTDERNLLTVQLGLEAEAPRHVAVVHRNQNLPIFESLNITRSIHPREVVASNILSKIEQSYAETVTTFDHEKADIFESTVSDNSPIAGCKVNALSGILPEPFIICALVRNGELIMPRGDTVPREDDGIIVTAPSETAERIADQI